MYVTWTGIRLGLPGEGKCCALSVIHIPESERR